MVRNGHPDTRQNRLSWFSGLLLLLSSSAFAATVDISVQTSFFSPNDVTIQPGDTIRWTYEGDDGGYCGPYGGSCGGEGEGAAHSIKADDGSFSSGPPSGSFVYQHTFEQPGVYPYHCQQHSQPGRDINTFMNGRIVVESDEPVFRINAGLNDAWYNPDTPGQGFFINVFPEIGQMFVAWFTFDTQRPDGELEATIGEPGHRWLTAFGPYADNQAVLNIEISVGGVFDSAQPPAVQHTDGTLTLEFTGCNAGTIHYDITSLGLQADIPIERIALDNLPQCEAMDAAGFP